MDQNLLISDGDCMASLVRVLTPFVMKIGQTPGGKLKMQWLCVS